MNKFNTVFVRLIFFITVSVNLFACYTGKKSEAAKMVAATKEVLVKETKEITQIDSVKERQLTDENIDTTINNRIISKLSNYNQELGGIQAKTIQTETLLAGNRSFRRNYKAVVLPTLTEMDSFINKSPVRMAKYRMIKDGIAQSKKRLYEMAAFFGPGKYDIPEDKNAMADTLFIPVVDSLINFANAYATIEQTGTIVVNGYADGMNIDNTSPLYDLLLAALKKTAASKEELNQQLSQLRADAISSLMEKLVRKKQDQFVSWRSFNIDLFENGQGETYPTKTIKDYTVDDERRRVVLIYWSVLPKD
jgi:hypothetical protein